MMRAVLIVMAAALLGSGLVAGDMPADVAAEVAKLKDKEPTVRQKAAAALGRMGPKAKPALPALCEALNDKTTWVITKSLMAMAEIGPDDTVVKPVTPFLAKFEEIRSLAVEVFVKMGEKAVPPLQDALKDETLAEGAIEALTALGPKAKDAKAALTEVSTKHKAKPVRDKAVKALKAIGGK